MNKKFITILLLLSFSSNMLGLTVFERQIINAAKEGKEDIIKFIINNPGILTSKKNINALDEEGHTALYYAAYKKDKPTEDKNYSGIVKFLLEKDADPNIADPQYGTTPLMRAAVQGDLKSLQALVDNPKMEINKVNTAGLTALDLAGTQERRNILLAKGAKKGSDLGAPATSSLVDLNKDLIEFERKLNDFEQKLQ